MKILIYQHGYIFCSQEEIILAARGLNIINKCLQAKTSKESNK